MCALWFLRRIPRLSLFLAQGSTAVLKNVSDRYANVSDLKNPGLNNRCEIKMMFKWYIFCYE